MCESVSALPTRSTAVLGPFGTDMLISIKKIGATHQGTVHQLCAPVLYDYNNRQKKVLEINSLPNDFIIRKNRMYLLSTFVSDIEYGIVKL